MKTPDQIHLPPGCAYSLTQHFPKAQRSPSHDNPAWSLLLLTKPWGELRKEASKAPRFSPMKASLFWKQWEQADCTYSKESSLKNLPPSRTFTKRVLFSISIRVTGKELQAIWYFWGLGSRQTSDKFITLIMQNEVTVPFQNRNHSCNRIGMWKEEQIRNTLLFQAAQSTVSI